MKMLPFVMVPLVVAMVILLKSVKTIQVGTLCVRLNAGEMQCTKCNKIDRVRVCAESVLYNMGLTMYCPKEIINSNLSYKEYESRCHLCYHKKAYKCIQKASLYDFVPVTSDQFDCMNTECPNKIQELHYFKNDIWKTISLDSIKQHINTYYLEIIKSS